MTMDVALRVGGGVVAEPGAGGICPARIARLRSAKLISDMLLVWGTMVLWVPACLSVAVLIRVVGGEPAVFRQERVGLNGRPFLIRKFRTMSGSGGTTTAIDDERVTRLGRVLRRWRIDELPQLWNVARGEMSLVGPRPEQRCLAAVYAAHLPEYHLRHLLRPGMTGLAQVSAPYAGNLEETRVKLAHDLDYMLRGSLAMDVWIMAKTPVVVIAGKGVR